MTTVVILGAGALGSLWAARLSRTHKVLILDRPQASGRDKRFSFTLQDSKGSLAYHLLRIAPSALANHSTDAGLLLLVCCKSYDLVKALEGVQAWLPEGTALVLFQNGLKSQHEAARRFPHWPIYAAVTTEGANRTSPAQVIHAGTGVTWIGAFNALASETQAQQIAQTLSASGLQVQAQSDISSRLWQKLAINAVINPWTALLGCRNGELRQASRFTDSYGALCAEIASIMNAATASHWTAAELQHLVDGVIERTALNRSSMLQDVQAGRQTEIEQITGFLVEQAERLGIDCPRNRELLQAVLKLSPENHQ